MFKQIISANPALLHASSESGDFHPISHVTNIPQEGNDATVEGTDISEGSDISEGTDTSEEDTASWFLPSSILNYFLRCLGILHSDEEDNPLHDQIEGQDWISNSEKDKHPSSHVEAIIAKRLNEPVDNFKIVTDKSELEKEFDEELEDDDGEIDEDEVEEIRKRVEEHKRDCDRQIQAARAQIEDYFNKLMEKKFWKTQQFYAMMDEPD